MTIKPITEAEAKKVVSWRYDRPYDVYNLAPEALPDLLEPEHAFHAVFDDEENLIGFCSFGQDGRVPGGHYELDALDVGAGLRPDLTGQGRGLAFLEAVLEHARQELAPRRFRATVGTFNARALAVLKKLKFSPVQSFISRGQGPPKPFIVMVKEEPKKVVEADED